ncbi:efflux RND transporter periplasmic adaptor subunit, partial [Sutterella sp.]|uniref:efflux RND transporter periplasmic adaptor subunit n=1 Tax=Sutterella sp. TaxID=1981025 RepID=UPI003FD89CBD
MSDAPTPPAASSSAPRKTGSLLPFVSVLCAALVGAGLGGWAVWHWQERIAAGLGIKTPAAAAVAAAQVPPGVELAEPDENGRPVLYWYDPMKPDAHFKKPGPSPFMDMDLVPKYADEAGALPTAAGITIDPTMVENLGVRSARAAEGRLTYETRVPAEVVMNEHAFALVQARSAGFVEEAAPLAVGDRVHKGDLLARVVIPGWSDAQAEYLVLVNSGAGQAEVEGVLRRLRLAGMPEDDVQELVRSRRVKTIFTLRAPIDGVLTDIALRSGMNVSTSQTVAQIEGLDPVWVTASVPERYAASLEGADLVLTADAYPGRSWHALKHVILPGADPATRTLRVR